MVAKIALPIYRMAEESLNMKSRNFFTHEFLHGGRHLGNI